VTATSYLVRHRKCKRERERKKGKKEELNEKYARGRKYPFDLYLFLFSTKERVSA